MTDLFREWLVARGVAEGAASYMGWAGLAVAVLILAVVATYISRKILLRAATFLIKKSRGQWDDALLEHNVLSRLAHLAPALVFYFASPLFPPIQDIMFRLSMVYLILTGLLTFNSLLTAASGIYNSYEFSRNRPIKGYVQVVKIIVTIIAAIFVLAIILGQKPGFLLGGLGAMTAVILLIFKDSLMGLVAGIQLSTNDMVRIGDWIEMPQYGADGDVIDISLNTVKIQNWDKTISTIPAYSLISGSFKNWRGMSESGGRRIKRSINIDIGSIKFCTEEMIAQFGKFELIADYIEAKSGEIAENNKGKAVDRSLLINRRNLTNIGTLRAYIVAYLRAHPKIHQGMTFLVRQLPPGEFGLPLEVYVFSNDQEWARYEDILADIFDHILAIIPMFGLRVYQRPSGDDLKILAASSGNTQSDNRV